MLRARTLRLKCPDKEKHEFLEHMKSSHHVTFNISQESQVLDMFKRPSRTPYAKCNLCFRPNVKIKSHVGRHLEQMALFALPRSGEAAEYGSGGLDSTAGVDGKLQAKASTDASTMQKESRKPRDISNDSRSNRGEADHAQELQVEGQDLEGVDQVDVPDAEVTSWDNSAHQSPDAMLDDLEDDASITTLLRNCHRLLYRARTGEGLNEYYYLMQTLRSLVSRL